MPIFGVTFVLEEGFSACRTGKDMTEGILELFGQFSCTSIHSSICPSAYLSMHPFISCMSVYLSRCLSHLSLYTSRAPPSPLSSGIRFEKRKKRGFAYDVAMSVGSVSTSRFPRLRAALCSQELDVQRSRWRVEGLMVWG